MECRALPLQLAPDRRPPAASPKTVRNMDSRARAISEASDAGVPLDHARAMATHSDQAQTIKYTRQDTAKVNNVLQMRAKHRAKKDQE